MKHIALNQFFADENTTIDPTKFSDERFELFSIPAFENDKPELLFGREIGSAKKLVQPDDILLSRIVPHIRRAWVVPQSNGLRQIASGEWIVFRSGQIIPQFCKYFLISDDFHTQFMKTVAGVGGSLLRARPEGTGRIEIPLPPLDEQRRIARILDQADRLRRLRRHARQQTDTFLQSVFVDMFGDPVSNPNNWDETIVEEVLARPLKAGLYIPKERYSFDKTTGIEMVHMSDAFYESVQRGSLKRAILTDKEIQEYALDHNDLLIARRSLNYEGAAKPCHILRSSEPLVFESSILRVTLNQKKILPAYFFQFFMNERARRKYVLKNVTQSTISGINQSGLNNTKLLIPPLNLQKDFERIIKAVATLQTQQQEAERQAEMNFQALLHQAFSGQLAQKVVEV